MTALDDFNSEMDFNVSQGECSQTFTIVSGTVHIPLDGIISKAWKREEKDGRLDPGSPMLIPSVLVPMSVLRSHNISVGMYTSLKVVDGEDEYGVVSYENTNPVRLFLKSGSSSDPEPDRDPEP